MSKYVIFGILMSYASMVIPIHAQTSDEQRLENFKPPPPSTDPGLAERLNNATTHTFDNGTTIQPNVGGRDKSVYDNPKDTSGTVGVKITH